MNLKKIFAFVTFSAGLVTVGIAGQLFAPDSAPYPRIGIAKKPRMAPSNASCFTSRIWVNSPSSQMAELELGPDGKVLCNRDKYAQATGGFSAFLTVPKP